MYIISIFIYHINNKETNCDSVMKIKKYIMALIVVATLLLATALASAGYSDSITDSTGDVYYWRWDGTSYSWRENVERPDIDITGASIQESGGVITVSIQVVGSIRDTDSHHYSIILEDENEDSYSIWFNDGTCFMSAPDFYGELEYSGIGTNTLEMVFSLEDVGNPESLRITSVETHDWLDEEETGEYYYDTAGPEADEPVNGNDNGEDDNGEDDNGEGIIDHLLARGMLCIALAIILPIIIIVIIVIIVKVLKKDDKSDGHPPSRYNPYQSNQIPSQSNQQKVNENSYTSSQDFPSGKNINSEKIDRIRNEIKSLKEKEGMIDTRKVEGALQENKLEKAEEFLEALKRKYHEYENILEELKMLDERITSLSNKLADGEIGPDTFKDAKVGIENRKYHLENKLEKLRNEIIYEDYEKPF